MAKQQTTRRQKNIFKLMSEKRRLTSDKIRASRILISNLAVGYRRDIIHLIKY